MSFILHLCLLTLAVQLPLSHPQTLLNFMPVESYHNLAINAGKLQIPENSWWKGLRAKTPALDRWPFASIQYLKNITEQNPIRLDYTVQVEQEGFFFNSWENVIHGSVYLCDRQSNTQDASILALVRELLGIPDGCPVLAGHMANVSAVQMPFKDRSLYFNVEVSIYNIRILTNIWDSNGTSANKLFTGQFYAVDPYYIASNPLF